MTTYYINVHFADGMETAQFDTSIGEDLFLAVMETLKNLGFDPHKDANLQKHYFTNLDVSYWKDNMEDGSLWELEWEWTGDHVMEMRKV